MKKNLFIVLLTSILITLSCKEKDVVSAEPPFSYAENSILIPASAKEVKTRSNRTMYIEGSVQYEAFAKEVARKMKDKDFRKFLKMEASKKFDGDNDILVKSIASKFTNIEPLLNETPKLNFGFNEIFKDWDTDKSSILVATRVNLGLGSKSLIAFDLNGKMYEIDTNTEPDKPVLVIGYNERIEFEKDGKIKVLNYINPNSTNDKNKKILACTYPYRSGSANYERLKGMKFNNLSTFEAWYDFKPEIRFRMYTPVSSSNFSTLTLIAENSYSPSRPSVDNCWWIFDAPLFIWNTPNYSTTMLYEFTEIDDSGATSTTTIGLSGSFGIGSNNSAGTPNVTASVTPTIGFSFTKKGMDLVIGRLPYGMLDCPPNSDDSYQFNAGTSGFYFKAGY